MSATIEKGHLMLWLEGERLHGGYHLVRTTGGDEKSWLMMRMKAQTAERLLHDWCEAHGVPDAECSAEVPPSARPSPSQGEEATAGLSLPVRKRAGATAPPDRAVARPLPQWVAPMTAETGSEAFSDPDWLFERKLDGERCLAFRHGQEVQLWSRARRSLNRQYPELVAALLEQPADDFVADGEIVAFRGDR